jgi:hypothetical protein
LCGGPGDACVAAHVQQLSARHACQGGRARLAAVPIRYRTEWPGRGEIEDRGACQRKKAAWEAMRRAVALPDLLGMRRKVFKAQWQSAVRKAVSPT